jgi:hypothetical protein
MVLSLKPAVRAVPVARLRFCLPWLHVIPFGQEQAGHHQESDDHENKLLKGSAMRIPGGASHVTEKQFRPGAIPLIFLLFFDLADGTSSTV